MNQLNITSGFLGSQEFTNLANGHYTTLSNAQFVTVMYQTAFDRTPDNAGLNGWVSNLQNGMSRAEMAAHFAGGTEMRNKVFDTVKDGIALDSFRSVAGSVGEAQDPLESWFDTSIDASVSLYEQAYEATVEGSVDDDVLKGSKRDDLIVAGDGDDLLKGKKGADRLIGGNGDDTLQGGKGADVLEGGAGNEQLTGGKAADEFVFAFDFEADSDVITDFTVGQDVINLGWLTFEAITITASTAGTVVTYGSDDTLLLQGVEASALSESDFTFADDPFGF